jgi:hypothetical protein
MMQRRRDRQAAMVVGLALAISLPAIPDRADSLIFGPTDEGTRTIAGNSPPTLVHPSQLFTILTDGADHTSVDSIVEFDIATITTIPMAPRFSPRGSSWMSRGRGPSPARAA